MKTPTITQLGLGAVLFIMAAGVAWALTLTPAVIDGSTAQGRAGSAFAIANLDEVGGNELLVGEPAYEAGDPPGGDQNTDGVGDEPDGPSGRVLIYAVSGGVPSTEPSVVLLGEGPDDRFGAEIQVGDVTNDGTPDVIVSAITASGHHVPRTGCIYVFDGTDLVFDTPPTELEAHDAVVEVCGTQYRGHFGSALAVGNFDGEPGLDIAVGANWYAVPHGHAGGGHPADGYMAGAVYLVPNGEIAAQLADPAYEIDAPITHGQGGWLAHYGDNLLAMGDNNGNGLDELLIFAPGAELSGHSGKGRAYLAEWDAMPHPGETEPAGFEEAMVVIRGNGRLAEGDPALLGDLTGDGFPEIGMASTTPGDKVSAGGIFIVDGDLFNLDASGPVYTAYDHDNDAGTVNQIANVSYAAVSGEKARDYFGTSMAALGDVNSDGDPDFAVGAPWADGFEAGDDYRDISGSVYIISGKGIADTPPSDRLKLAVRRSTTDNAVIEATLLGEKQGISNDRLGQAMTSGELISSPGIHPVQMVMGAPDRDPDTVSTTNDVPGSGSNDNRGAAIITSFAP